MKSGQDHEFLQAWLRESTAMCTGRPLMQARSWFHFDGGGTALVYSGERFKSKDRFRHPLKIQRNAVQDPALLTVSRRGGRGGNGRSGAALQRISSRGWWNRDAHGGPASWGPAD
jgi:hypothetical protein